MVSFFASLGGTVRSLAVAASCLVLAGCQISAPGAVTKEDRSGPVPVALLLPYGSSTSSDAVVAKAIENAARLAIADLEGVQIDLRIYSTAGQATTGAAAAQKAVTEGAEVILGPLYADVAAAVGVAVPSDMPVMAFSNNTAVAGGNVFLLGNTYQNTAKRIANYAAAQGRNRIAILHSSDTSGLIAKDAVTAAIAGTSATVVATVPYELSQTGVVQAVPSVSNAVKKGGANSVFFTSSTSGALPIFAQLLPEAGVSDANVQFMGLARWDIPAEALKLPGLQGGWFALPDPTVAAAFNSRFKAANGSAPHPIASLGFDGIAAIGTIAKAGNAIDATSLTSSDGFRGGNGIFRLLSDGTNERAIAIAKIVNNQIQVISPAPTRFGSAGS